MSRFARHRRLRFEPLEDRRVLAALYQPVGGDYNVDSSVNAADYVLWRKSAGQSVDRYSGADGNGNGTVDQADHSIWRASFGYSGPPRPNIGFATFESASGTQLVLEVVGTDTSDLIAVTSGADPLDLTVTYQNAQGASVQRTVPKSEVIAATTFSGLTFRGVYVSGLASNDLINVSGLRTAAIVEAGAGADDITGGVQADLIHGGRGNDVIRGGGGRDLVIGGRDGDQVDGGAADDILIGGEPTLTAGALDAALTLWNGAGNYIGRVTSVLGNLVANQNVIEDQVVDTLSGGADRDLFFAAVGTPSNNDAVTDFNSGQEQVKVTHPPILAGQLVSEAIGVVFVGNDSSIDYVRIAVPSALWSGSTPDAITLEITLVEQRGDGSEVHLQTLTLLLSAATLVSLNGGPGGAAVVEINTTTTALHAGYIGVNVTTTLRGPGILDGVGPSFATSVILEPVRPA